MQKGKRYRGMDGTLYELTFDGEDYCLRESSGRSILLPAAHLRRYVSDGTLVELPDDALDTYIDRFVEAGWAEAVSGASQLKARCTHTNPDGSDAWVNQGFMHVLMACRLCGDKKP